MRWLPTLALLLAACSPVTPTPSAAPSIPSTQHPTGPTNTSPTPTSSAATCSPTDQDAYVYHPARLTVQAACTRVSGTIAAIRTEADGDDHILVALDAQYRYLLTPANSGIELGDLVVEPVCEHAVTQSDAVAICAQDHDPLGISGIKIGDHLWLEGRYVLDTAHGGWAELHPLYRFGALAIPDPGA